MSTHPSNRHLYRALPAATPHPQQESCGCPHSIHVLRALWNTYKVSRDLHHEFTVRLAETLNAKRSTFVHVHTTQPYELVTNWRDH